MSVAPLPNEKELISNIPFKYKAIETYNFSIKENKYLLKISYNDDQLYFYVLEENSFLQNEFSLCQNYEQLKLVDKYFSLFENIEEIFNSLKRIISNKNLTLMKENKNVKLQIYNSLTNKNFNICLPQKEKDLNSTINILTKKVIDLENELKIVKNENNNLNKKMLGYEDIIKNLEKNFNEKLKELENKIIEKNEINKNKNSFDLFKNSSIVKSEDTDLILSWFDKKPSNFNLLLDSKIDGDSNSTFKEKCFNKSPTMVFVKTTDNLRFGGFTSVTWPEKNYKKDANSFLFSLDKKKKYKIKENQKENAIYYCQNISFCFGSGCDLYINDKCTLKDDNQVGDGSYDLPSECELNNGKKMFKVLNYEVYCVEF